MENTTNNTNHFCFFFSETREIHTKSDNIKIMIDIETEDAIN